MNTDLQLPAFRAGTRPRYSIKFPLVKERIKHAGRRGPRYQLVVDRTGLVGARAAAAGMVAIAMSERREIRTETDPITLRWRKAKLRIHSMWARVFAGHFDFHDPRYSIADAECLAASVALNAQLAERQRAFEAEYPELALSRAPQAAA
jgi:hypothetical protein